MNKLFNSARVFIKTARFVMRPTSNNFMRCLDNAKKRYKCVHPKYRITNELMASSSIILVLNGHFKMCDLYYEISDSYYKSMFVLCGVPIGMIILFSLLYPYMPILSPACVLINYICKKRIKKIHNNKFGN